MFVDWDEGENAAVVRPVGQQSSSATVATEDYIGLPVQVCGSRNWDSGAGRPVNIGIPIDLTDTAQQALTNRCTMSTLPTFLVVNSSPTPHFETWHVGATTDSSAGVGPLPILDMTPPAALLKQHEQLARCIVIEMELARARRKALKKAEKAAKKSGQTPK
jgi:hypothetical protein